jgi:hypothetical protein
MYHGEHQAHALTTVHCSDGQKHQSHAVLQTALESTEISQVFRGIVAIDTALHCSFEYCIGEGSSYYVGFAMF